MCDPDHRYSIMIEQLWLLISESFDSVYNMPWLLAQEKLAAVTLFLPLFDDKSPSQLFFWLHYLPSSFPTFSPYPRLTSVDPNLPCNFLLRYFHSALNTYSLDYIFIFQNSEILMVLISPSASPTPPTAQTPMAVPSPLPGQGPPDLTPAHSTACPQGDAQCRGLELPLYPPAAQLPSGVVGWALAACPALTGHHTEPPVLPAPSPQGAGSWI